MYASFVALTAGLAATASAFDCSGPYFSFYNRGGSAMSYQRLDPALFPGMESSHLHSFDGGNALAATMDYDTTQKSTCTTARIKPDKSIYWRPTLFWNGNNTGFYRVPEMYSKVYYKFGDAGNVKANVSEFPGGFRMIAGNPFLRAEDTMENAGPGVSWSCKGASSNTDAQGFPSGFTSCPNGFATQITFPSCWDGKDFEPSNPNAHMSYPTASGMGLDACPTGFQVARFPAIFIEFWWDVSSFDDQYSADSTPWALSMGDNTGYGFHADFLNGWEKGVLGKATADEGYCNCGCGCGEDQMKTCFGDDQVNNDDDEDFLKCAATPEYPGDDGSPLTKLPGCNPIQSGPALATVVTGAGCSATGAASAVSSAASSAASAASTSAKAMSSAMSAGAKAVSSALSSAVPTLSVSMGNKQQGSQTYGFASMSTVLTSSVAASTAPEASSNMTSVPAMTFNDGTYVKPTQVPTSAAALESDVGCKAPTYITITPTVYVTAGADGNIVGNSTDCPSTVYTTVTNRKTVTVPAPSHGHHAVHSSY